MNARSSLRCMLILLALLGLSFSRALAKEITGVTISGPGLPGEIELSDGQDIEVASAPWHDFSITDQPEGMQNASYYVVRLEISAEAETLGKSTLHYYPGERDQSGYIFYADCQGCTGSFQTWIRVPPSQDLALRELLVRLGAPAQLTSEADPSRSGLEALIRQSGLGLVALALLALGGFVFVRSRVRKQAFETS